jgi:hypothetical protein
MSGKRSRTVDDTGILRQPPASRAEVSSLHPVPTASLPPALTSSSEIHRHLATNASSWDDLTKHMRFLPTLQKDINYGVEDLQKLTDDFCKPLEDFADGSVRDKIVKGSAAKGFEATYTGLIQHYRTIQAIFSLLKDSLTDSERTAAKRSYHRAWRSFNLLLVDFYLHRPQRSFKMKTNRFLDHYRCLVNGIVERLGELGSASDQNSKEERAKLYEMQSSLRSKTETIVNKAGELSTFSTYHRSLT